jgi:hypothetical protein
MHATRGASQSLPGSQRAPEADSQIIMLGNRTFGILQYIPETQ